MASDECGHGYEFHGHGGKVGMRAEAWYEGVHRGGELEGRDSASGGRQQRQ